MQIKEQNKANIERKTACKFIVGHIPEAGYNFFFLIPVKTRERYY